VVLWFALSLMVAGALLALLAQSEARASLGTATVAVGVAWLALLRGWVSFAATAMLLGAVMSLVWIVTSLSIGRPLSERGPRRVRPWKAVIAAPLSLVCVVVAQTALPRAWLWSSGGVALSTTDALIAASLIVGAAIGASSWARA
jgi:hypothetical protein